ncbi:OmpA family protein [Telmatospirillum sp.]|uniref:OmpA family protein n=1 Tax=Telmatospirillum sp. TaxID=2079197 RepID=UPI002844D7F7|nr:OmpA family protein [Telmatospirillum sp.]MDR3439980.1 outer membrane beta-barrel protein [Telmatospirillum sp.]
MRIVTGILSAGLVIGIASAAQAQTDGWYAGVEAGPAVAPTIKFKDGSKTWKENQDIGYAVLGQVGYGFGPMRVEGELGWRSNDVDTVKQPFNGATGHGSLNASSAMANAYYDFHNESRFTPYLGVGAGGVDVSADKIRANGTTFSNKDHFAPAYQGIAGISYALDNNLSLKADYHYLHTVMGSLKEDPSYGSGKSKGDYTSHALLFGVTYKFGEPAKPAPAYKPSPVAAPAPVPTPKTVQAAPIAKNYLVFFDFDKSNITPEGSKSIGQAAANAKANNATSISLTGYTDAAGSEKYNMALSLRRANAVKTHLVTLGIPANEISVVGKGKTDQLVPTADGVHEPQNRRVLIVLP